MQDFRPASAADRLRHVFLHDMVLLASVGVHAHEHTARQRLRINLDLAVLDDFVDPPPDPAPSLQQELGRVVDYEQVAARVRAIVNAGHVRLVETLAERLALSCLQDGRVRVVRVRVEKLDIFADIAAVGVEIERRAGGVRAG
jgi:dihydroneopterin aldolase